MWFKIIIAIDVSFKKRPSTNLDVIYYNIEILEYLNTYVSVIKTRG